MNESSLDEIYHSLAALKKAASLSLNTLGSAADAIRFMSDAGYSASEDFGRYGVDILEMTEEDKGIVDAAATKIDIDRRIRRLEELFTKL